MQQAIATFHGLYRIPAERSIGPYELLEELGAAVKESCIALDGRDCRAPNIS